jgi:hypothetical protein
MTMIPDIMRADSYDIRITKAKEQINLSDNDMFLFEYKEGYDKNNQDHIDAFKNIEQIKNFHEQSLSTYGKVSIESDEDNMTISLKMIAPFEKLANFVSMEFLMCGSLGKITLLDFISMAATSIVTNVATNNDCDCTETDCENNMYV